MTTTTALRGSPRVGGTPRHAWTIVAAQELRDLWLSPRGLTMLLSYSVILGALTYMFASNTEVNLLDARESVGLIVQVAIALGALSALIVSADAISGERQRETIETLLLTPCPRRDLVSGKLIAAVSVWFGTLAVAVPYVLVVSSGPGVTADAMFALVVGGTLVAVALTALGLAVSAVVATNRASLVIAIVLLLALAAPSQLPSSSTAGIVGDLLISANPASAVLRFAGRTIIDQATLASEWHLLLSPAIAAVLMTGVALVSSRKIGLGGGR